MDDGVLEVRLVRLQCMTYFWNSYCFLLYHTYEAMFENLYSKAVSLLLFIIIKTTILQSSFMLSQKFSDLSGNVRIH